MDPKSKKPKLSQDYLSDSDSEPGQSATKKSDSPKAVKSDAQGSGNTAKNADGETFFELSSRRRITVRQWKSSTLIDIREFWEEGGVLKPGKKGISLSLDQWKQLLKLAPEIDAAIKELPTK